MSLRTVTKDEPTVTLYSGELRSVPMSLDEFKELPGKIAQARAYLIPSEDTFDEADYLPGHDLEALLSKLIDRHATLFSHIERLKIVCLWKAKGGASKGKQTFGKVQAATGLVGFFSEADFVIWLAADHLREKNASERTVEACLFHEACHIQWDADGGKVLVVDHDFYGFTEELRAYGAWRTDLEKAAKAFEQLALPITPRSEASG